MKNSIKRILTAISIIALTVSSVLITPPAQAETMTTSESCIAFIKDYEGFRSHVYWDSGSAFIGYGTICRSWDYPDGISRETADTLMRQALKVKEDTVNKVLAKYNVQLNQNQFDAILSFTYNLGTGWMNSGTRLYNYLINGISNYTDIQIVNAIGTWCHQGKSVNNILVERRLEEAKIFLYGDYTGTDPHSYRYLTFDARNGSVENSIVFFECGMPYGEFQKAELVGRTFAGWITSGGVYITPSVIVEKNMEVSAIWSDGAQPVQNTIFPDVLQTDWFYTYVNDLSAKNIIKGLSDGRFYPGRTVTNGEALKLILLSVGFAEQVPTDSHWASGYLATAVSKGIVNPGEITDLNAVINRQMIAQITAKAIGLPALEPETLFKDTSDGFVLALYYCNIISGTTREGALVFNPADSITRAEISSIIWRVGQSSVIPY